MINEPRIQRIASYLYEGVSSLWQCSVPLVLQQQDQQLDRTNHLPNLFLPSKTWHLAKHT
jgi:hypothetical protein